MVNLGSPPMLLATGLILSGAVAVCAYRVRALIRCGLAAAVALGTITFCLGYRSGGLLHFLEPAFPPGPGPEKGVVGRNCQGVASRCVAGAGHGGPGTLLALLSLSVGREWAYIPFVATMAAAMADTWATEIGTRGSARPRLVTAGRPVQRGSSGAVSAAGTAASILGGAFFGALALAALAIEPVDASSAAGVQVLAGGCWVGHAAALWIAFSGLPSRPGITALAVAEARRRPSTGAGHEPS